MDRKLNLAKIASKTSKTKNSVINPTITKALPQSTTESPYFSPVAGRTRNKRDNDAKLSVSGIKLKSTETKPTSASEAVSKIEKKLATEPKKSAARKHVKVEYDENEKPINKKEVKYEPTEDQEQPPPKEAKKRTSKESNIKTEPKFKTDPGTSDDSASSEKQIKWEPNNWREQLANIREMRKERNAPVDTMGCDKCYDQYSDEKTKRFHHLVSN